MSKIKLSNGTIHNVESVDGGCIAVVMADLTEIATYVDAFTKENLSRVEVLDENNNVVSILKDKYLLGFDGTQVVESTDFIVCFRIADVYTLEERIAKLEAENEELKASQEIQDEAIVELAEIVAE